MQVTYTVTEADLPGPLTGTVTAQSTDSTGKPVTGTTAASVELTYVSAFIVDKKASEATAKVGDTITYTYTVNNTGNTTLSGFALTDDKLGSIVVTPDSIKPGETATGTANYIVAENDLPGPIVNALTATATDSKGNTITSSASASVDITYSPGCLIDGADLICQGKTEMFLANVVENPAYTYEYDWSMDETELGTGKSIKIAGGDYSLGNHTLQLTVSSRYGDAEGAPKTTSKCTKSVEVAPEPVAEWSMSVAR